MQRTNECISEIFDIGKLFVAMVDEKSSRQHPKYKQPQVGEKRTGENSADHDPRQYQYNLKKFYEDARVTGRNSREMSIST
jgi:hypothetical protein